MIQIESVNFDDFIPSWHNKSSIVRFYILILVVQGRVRYRLNGGMLDLRRSDMLLIPPGTVRQAENHPEGPHQKYTALFRPASHSTLPFAEVAGPRAVSIHNAEYMKQRFAALYRQRADKQPFYEAVCEALCAELAALFFREERSNAVSPMKQRLAEQMKEYMIAHYRRPIRADELAAHIGRSPNYTISLFKEATGQTPVDFIFHLRISAARELLAETNMTLAEIAEHLGFYDASHFHRIFKRITGSSPSESKGAGRG